jgi:hypothetical protein
VASLVGLSLLAPVLLLGVLVLAIASAAGGRNEPDPEGERPHALYLAAVAFVTLFLSLGAFTTIVSSAVDAGLGDDGPSATTVDRVTIGSSGFEGDFEPPEPVFSSGSGDERDNERIRTIVIAGIMLAVAGSLFLWHERRLAEFRLGRRGPGWRTAQTAGHVVCFLALLVALGAVVTFGYAIFEMLAPGVAGIAERDDGLQPAIVSAVVAVAAAGIFVYHWPRLHHARPGGTSYLAEVVDPLPPPTDVPPPPPPPPTPPRRDRPLRPPTV